MTDIIAFNRMCQFLIGTVQRYASRKTVLGLVKCQFLIGTVQHENLLISYMYTTCVSIPYRYGTTVNYISKDKIRNLIHNLCQFLIGTVQLYLH